MEILAKKDATGLNLLEFGPVTIEMSNEVVKALYQVVDKRLSESATAETEVLQKKLTAYKALASKMRAVDDRIIQKFAVQLLPEQLVTLVRLSGADSFYQKVLRNLSKQNRRQFEIDYQEFKQITVHQACIYMEQIVPYIKKAAQEQRAMQEQVK